MHSETLSIHFHLPATDALGRMHVDGKLRCEEDGLILQYKVRERTFKTEDSTLKTIEFPYREVEEVRYAGGWWRKRLILKTKDAAILEDLPGSDLGRVTMMVNRKSRRAAAKIESFVDFKKSEVLVEDLHERLERSRSERDEE